MPTFERHVHYRSVDVSSIKELVRRWYPRVYYQAPTKAGNHRALADVQESIEELRYYRDAVFVAQPDWTARQPRRSLIDIGALTGRSSSGVSALAQTPAGTLHAARVVRETHLGLSHGGCSSAGRAPGCGPGCRGFESRHSPHRKP